MILGCKQNGCIPHDDEKYVTDVNEMKESYIWWTNN